MKLAIVIVSILTFLSWDDEFLKWRLDRLLWGYSKLVAVTFNVKNRHSQNLKAMLEKRGREDEKQNPFSSVVSIPRGFFGSSTSLTPALQPEDTGDGRIVLDIGFQAANHIQVGSHDVQEIPRSWAGLDDHSHQEVERAPALYSDTLFSTEVPSPSTFRVEIGGRSPVHNQEVERSL